MYLNGKVEKITIDFEQGILIVNEELVKEPVIVSVPYEAGYPRTKIFNYQEGCCKDRLPKISVITESLGR